MRQLLKLPESTSRTVVTWFRMLLTATAWACSCSSAMASWRSMAEARSGGDVEDVLDEAPPGAPRAAAAARSLAARARASLARAAAASRSLTAAAASSSAWAARARAAWRSLSRSWAAAAASFAFSLAWRATISSAVTSPDLGEGGGVGDMALHGRGQRLARRGGQRKGRPKPRRLIP